MPGRTILGSFIFRGADLGRRKWLYDIYAFVDTTSMKIYIYIESSEKFLDFLDIYILYIYIQHPLLKKGIYMYVAMRKSHALGPAMWCQSNGCHPLQLTTHLKRCHLWSNYFQPSFFMCRISFLEGSWSFRLVAYSCAHIPRFIDILPKGFPRMVHHQPWQSAANRWNIFFVDVGCTIVYRYIYCIYYIGWVTLGMLAHVSVSGFFHQFGPSTPYKESRALHVPPLSVLFATKENQLVCIISGIFWYVHGFCFMWHRAPWVHKHSERNPIYNMYT